MRRMKAGLWALAGAGILILAAACSRDDVARLAERQGGLPPGSPCPRPEPGWAAADSVVVLRELPQLCRLVFRETGIEMRSDPSGSRPDPGPLVARDRSGRFYTASAAGFPVHIALWDADGSFLLAFGGPGEGPGEMGNTGGLQPQVDSWDRLHVRDARRVWTVFDRDQNFVRRTPAAAIGEIGFLQGASVLNDGRVVSGSVAFPVDPEFHFRLVDSTGAIVQRFSPKDPALVDAAPYTDRVIAYAGGDSFWAGPPIYDGYSPDGYVLEEWGVDGQRIRRVRREVPWLPIRWPPPPPPAEERRMSVEPRPASVSRLHLDDQGVLLMISLLPSARWAELAPRRMELPTEEAALMYEVRVEAIDTRAGVVLSSDVFAGDVLEHLPRLIRGSRLSARMTDEDLLPVLQILEYDLVTR